MVEVRILADQIRKELIRKNDVWDIPKDEISSIDLREMYENEGKDTLQRIIELQVESMTRKFCSIMEKYYQSSVTYREKCKQRVQRQSHIGEICEQFHFFIDIFF